MADQHVRRGLANLSVSQKVNAGGLATLVDIVLVIDGTGSMGPLFEAVKESALSFYSRVIDGLADKRRRVENMRLKVIVYRDLYCDETPFEESRFFNLPEEKESFEQFVRALKATGGGDEPESGLEALWKAIHTDFQSNEEGKKARQIICLMTDASAHPLESPKRLGCSNYPNGVPADLLGLEDEWGALDPHAKRLLIFAPNAYPWVDIQTWPEAQLTISAAGTGLGNDVYESAINLIAGSV